ncbi:MAG: hypothetical protein ACRCR9_01345 [Chitinophagaceae bacterium]
MDTTVILSEFVRLQKYRDNVTGITSYYYDETTKSGSIFVRERRKNPDTQEWEFFECGVIARFRISGGNLLFQRKGSEESRIWYNNVDPLRIEKYVFFHKE